MGGAALSWLYWKLVLDEMAVCQVQRRLFKLFVLLLGVGTVLPFALALRNSSVERIKDVGIGCECALVAISIVGSFLWRLGKFFQDDSREAERPEPR